MKRGADLADNSATIGAIAVLAYIVADVVHEAIGHGGACWLGGGKIRLLASAFFQCVPPTRLADAGGSLANLVAAFLLWLALQSRKSSASDMRLLLALVFAFNLFWASAQMIYSAALNRDDWYFALDGLVAGRLWRPALVLLGGALYIFGIRTLARELGGFTAADEMRARRRKRRILLVSYAAPGLMGCLAALLYRPDPWGAMREVALETFAANLGLVVLSRRLRYLVSTSSRPAPEIFRSRRWLVLAVAAFCAFVAVLGRGL